MTEKEIFELATEGINPQDFTKLISELNISRRNSLSYPKGHQIAEASLQKVLNTYSNLRSTGEKIVVGVAFDALLIGNTALDKSNKILRDFARVLYDRGIGTLVLHRGLTIGELRNLVWILGTKREDIYGDGGIENVWHKAGISSIEIRAIRYDMFTTTEEARISKNTAEDSKEGLWERFSRSQVAGELCPGGIVDSCLDPDLLADALNRQ